LEKLFYKTGLSLSLESPVASFSTPIANFFFVDEFYEQQAISPVASRENQSYSAITGVTGYTATLNENPAKVLISIMDNVSNYPCLTEVLNMSIYGFTFNSFII